MTRACLAVALLLACAPAEAESPAYQARPGLISAGGIIVFFHSHGPLSYNTLTPGDLPAGAEDAGPVLCKSCQHGVSIPTASPFSGGRSTNLSGAYGDGGFQKAIRNLKAVRPDIAGVYDVKVDLHKISVLGFYRRVCTEVSARGFKLSD